MAHAKLSPSGAKRWISCPGSVALIGDSTSPGSQAAMMGTAAHKLLEIALQRKEWSVREYINSTFLVKAEGDAEVEFYPPTTKAKLKNDDGTPRKGWHMFVADEKMVEGVQVTLDEVKRIYDSFAPGTEIYTERYLDGSWLDPRFGGTADVTLVEPFGRIALVDHKNGYLLVEVTDNDQLKQYAVFLLHEHPEGEEFTVTISQPNAPHKDGLIRSQSFTIDELQLYQLHMKEAAEATGRPDAPRRAGDWCTFCPAKTRCPEFDAMLQGEVLNEFSFEDDVVPVTLPMPRSPDELARKMRWIQVIESWINNIKSDVMRELENGNKVPGFKLVRGRSKRRWTSEDKVREKLVEEIGLDESEIHVAPKLKTPAQMEKLGVGKEQRKLIKSAVSELAFMPNGSLTVAPDTDPREAVTALDDVLLEFADDDETNASDWSFE